MAVLGDEDRRAAEAIMARYPDGRARSAVLPLLYLMQSVQGSVTQDGLREVAELLGIRTAEVEAVASFYTMLRLRPTGTHVISVCTNLSCALRGAGGVFDAALEATGVEHGQETSTDGAFTIHEEECLGACDAAPVVQIDFANHDRVTRERMAELVEAVRSGEVPEPSRGHAPRDFRHASRVLAGVPGGSGSERVTASDSPPVDGAEEPA